MHNIAASIRAVDASGLPSTFRDVVNYIMVIRFFGQTMFLMWLFADNQGQYSVFIFSAQQRRAGDGLAVMPTITPMMTIIIEQQSESISLEFSVPNAVITMALYTNTYKHTNVRVCV